MGRRGSTSVRLDYRLLEQHNYGRAALLLDISAGPPTYLIYLRNITRQQGPELAIERWATVGFNLVASVWLQLLRTYSTYETGQGVSAGSSYTALDLARDPPRDSVF